MLVPGRLRRSWESRGKFWDPEEEGVKELVMPVLSPSSSCVKSPGCPWWERKHVRTQSSRKPPGAWPGSGLPACITRPLRGGWVRPSSGKPILSRSTRGPFTKSLRPANCVLAWKNGSLMSFGAHRCLLTCWRANQSWISGTEIQPFWFFLSIVLDKNVGMSRRSPVISPIVGVID